MRNVLVVAALCAVVGIVVFAGQTPAPQTPAPNADPYANNAVPGATTFPLAAPAGKDSGARMTAPAGALNQGAFNPATWKYGTAFNPPHTPYNAEIKKGMAGSFFLVPDKGRAVRVRRGEN